MANSVYHDETPRSAASHLCLHCLLRPVCPSTHGKYSVSTAKVVQTNLNGFCSDMSRRQIFERCGSSIYYINALFKGTEYTVDVSLLQGNNICELLFAFARTECHLKMILV